MSARDHERISELFGKALELDEEGRAEFLDRECAGEPELRREVESLLANAEDVPGILRTGAMPNRAGAVEPTPERVGPYRILGLLAEGGMGVVYRARQETPIRREVAVKLVRSGLETEQVIARFESERQALALMDHPNIARVFDAGATEQGRPYFAMEYVAGEPITDYCHRHRLTLAERLALFVEVCDGVQHAHHKGIIHRDLKPSNVLVARQGDTPIPKIIDFGVAKALGPTPSRRTLETASGQLVGTLEYMSPEQAELNGNTGDTRTDVYGLGLLLYELLAGVPLYDPQELRHQSLGEIRRRILTERPSAPSRRVADGSTGKYATDPVSLSRRLRGDLDTITMKALEKDPELRYSSPAELAADIGRHLRCEPVLAGSPSASYRMRKFVRKHRIGFGFAAALTAVVLTFAVTGAVQAERIARESERARQEAELAARVSGFLVGLFEAPFRIGARKDSRDPIEMLDQSVEKTRQDLADRPVLQAQLLQAMGDVYHTIRSAGRAQRLLEEAAGRLRELAGPDAPATLSALNSLARLYRDTGRLDDAEALYREVLEARRRLIGADHPDTLRSMNNLAFLYKMSGRLDLAEPLFVETVEGLSRVLGEDHPETLIARGFLAGVSLDLKRYEELEPVLRELHDTMPRVLGFYHLEAQAAIYNLGCVYANLGDPHRALDLVERAVDVGFANDILADPHIEPVRGDPRFPEVARKARLNAVWSWGRDNERADRYRLQRRDEEAEPLYAGVVEAARRRKLEGHVDARHAARMLAELYWFRGRYEDAERLYVNVVEGATEEHGERHTEVASALMGLMECKLGQGDRSGARELFDRAASIFAPAENTSLFACIRAMAAGLDGDRDEAMEYLRLAADRGWSNAPWAAHDLTLTVLHGDPEFDNIVERIWDNQD